MTHLLQALQARAGEFISLRRDFHRRPEPAFEEHRTAALVADKLEGWGYEVERGVGGTGVVGTLVRGGGTRRLGLRADFEALPIAKSGGAEWSSVHRGMLHASGQDGHTAMLLAAARHLAEQGAFDGTLHLIFQPAEEGGGAPRMMADGLFERFPCDAVFAMHSMPGMAQGRLVLREGAAMASSDHATITLTGMGGCGAMPHRAADPMMAAASIVMALQTIVSCHVDPRHAAAVTVGALHAGKANNAIPSSATLELSIRALDREVRAMLERRIKALAAAQAASLGVQVHVDWRAGCAVLVSTAAETALARAVAVELVGAERVTLQGPPLLIGSEDFAFMLERVPGSYVLIGNGFGNGHGEGGCLLHKTGCEFNDDNLAIGSAYWVLLAERFLAQKDSSAAR